jgi:hypothetical protein
MRKLTSAIVLASALLIASPLSGYAARGSVSPRAHARVGRTAWGGHPSGGSGHSSGTWGHSSGGGGHYHGGSQFYFGGSFALGPWWWPGYGWYPWYPYAYYPAPYYSAPPAVVQQQPQVYSQPEEQEADYWYYCQDPRGYYPYVKSCPGGWMKVVPQPTPPRQ